MSIDVAPPRPLTERLSEAVRSFDGPLTHELVLAPGQFGLGQLPAGLQPTAVTQTVCGFCSTGCGLTVHLRDGEALGLTPSTNYPVNLGMACPKGWEALTVLESPDRATRPLLRDPSGTLQPTTWDEALRTFCSRFQELQNKHGPESVAFLSTGQIPTEEMLFLGALAKFGMGFIHGDSNTRQCMATAATAYKQSFGFDAPPYTYADFEESDVLVFVGANPCVAHPIMWERVLRNRREPKIIVVDPRRTETAVCATQHVPISPKSDLTLLYAVAHLLIKNEWIDAEFVAAHTSGFAEFAAHVMAASYEPATAAAACGVAVAELEQLAATIHAGERVSFWWTMGVNQSYEGVRTAQAIINLALITGNIGRPGTGANSITGQCNAMGSRMFSCTASLPCGREFTKEPDRREVAELLELDVAKIPDRDSLCYDQILDAVREGRIRGLWIIATNTAHSWIQQSEAREALAKLDFLVVQDMYTTTETAQAAHLVLPAAGWGEKEGTFINSERRFGLLKKVARAPGSALADFSIFRLLAEYWGCGEPFASWTTPEAVFERMKRLSAGRTNDITGIRDYLMLDQANGIQWPCNAETAAQIEAAEQASPVHERRLFADGRFAHPDGRARLLFAQPQGMPEPPDDSYPLVLLTGRGSVSQWHTQTRTSKSAVLRKLYPSRCYVEVHPDDAARHGIAAGDVVAVESRRGQLAAYAFLSSAVGRGRVFLPMHYAAVNRLTLAHFDPYSRQPSYKDCAVRIRRTREQPEA
ncbi:MAG: nitrate reductase [Pirellula sp.]|nr:nitrate reductase [Pirellula sp.]